MNIKIDTNRREIILLDNRVVAGELFDLIKKVGGTKWRNYKIVEQVEYIRESTIIERLNSNMLIPTDAEIQIIGDIDPSKLTEVTNYKKEV